jgi:hypothetical protein
MGRTDCEVIMAREGTIHFVAGILSVACCASAESDLDEYVSSIRRSGMSEGAAGDVRTVASILSGSSTFRAMRTEDGTLGRSHGSPDDSNLGGERLKEVRARRAAKHEAWTEYLKERADTDGSGFVSTKEGWDLRRRIETVLVAAQLRPGSFEELQEAIPDASEEDLAAYAAMRAEAARQGLEGMPALPETLNTAPR